MTDNYVQEPAEVYGEQIEVRSRLDFHFSPLGNKVIDALPHLGTDAFVVYCVLLRYTNRETHVCWPTYATLQHHTGLGRKKLMAALKRLEDARLIDRRQMRKGKEFGANLYTLLPLADWEMSPVHGGANLGGAKMGPPRMAPPYRHHKQEVLKQDLSLTKTDSLEKEERAREDFSEHGEEEKEPEALHDVRLDEKGCTLYDMQIGLPCPHVQAAQVLLAPILGYAPKPHENLWHAVHNYELFDLLAVAKRWTEKREREDWTLGQIYSPKTLDARLAAVKAPSGHAARKRDPGDMSRYGVRTYRDFQPLEPVPEADRLSVEEVKGLVQDVAAKLNRGEEGHDGE